MATLQELEDRRDALTELISTTEARLAGAITATTRQSLTKTLTDARAELATLENEITLARRAAPAALGETGRRITQAGAQANFDQLNIAANRAQDEWLKDPANETKYQNWQKAAQSLYNAEQAAVKAGAQITPTIARSGGVFGRVGAPVTRPGARTVTSAEERRQAALAPTALTSAAPDDEGTPTPEPGPAAPSGPRVAPAAPAAGRSDFNTWAEAQRELRGLPDSPETTKTLRAEYRKQGTFTGDWEAEFRRRFPADQYLLDLDPEVKAIAQRAVNENWNLYPEAAKSLITRLIANTQYGLKTNTTQRTFDARPMPDQMDLIEDKMSKLKGTYGSLGLDDNEWFNIARTSARNGNNDDQNKSLIYSTVYRRDPRTGELAFQAAVAQVEQSKLAQDVNGVFTNEYLLAKPEGDYIESYARGELTLEDVRRQARVLAKQQFPGLSSFIDQGINVKTIADQYKSQAAAILELPSTTIDMNDPKFRVALDARGDGESRALSFGEWETLLKTNPNYGWQYTKTANKQALDIATTIARAFGKVV